MKVLDLSSEELVSRLMISVINYKENEDKLQSFPVIRKGNFAILAQLCVGQKNDAGQYTACLTVTNSMLGHWGMPKDKMFEIAADNSKKLFPTVYQPLEQYLDKSYAGTQMLLPDGMDISNIVVLTNEQHYNGAATIFYDTEILGNIAEQYKAEKMLLLPSSVNQVYCIPVRNGEELRESREIFADFLQMFSEEERLAENVLSYDNDSKTITEADGQTYGLDLSEGIVRKHEHGR